MFFVFFIDFPLFGGVSWWKMLEDNDFPLSGGSVPPDLSPLIWQQCPKRQNHESKEKTRPCLIQTGAGFSLCLDWKRFSNSMLLWLWECFVKLHIL